MKIKESLWKFRWFILIIFLLFIQFYELPYYYTEPGGALELSEVIKVENGYDEEGSFMLTTVRMGKANIPFYFFAKMSEYRELKPVKEVQQQGESDKEYHYRQLLAMESSQNAAKIIAYKQANKEYEIKNKGVLVTSIVKGMPAESVLKLGDIIIAVEDETIETAEQLVALLSEQANKGEVLMTILREQEEKEVLVQYAPFPKELGAEEGTKGIGISNPITEREISFTPSLEIDTSKIGGPSAGLMFSLEIYNQLVEGDLTKGYHIAGTGTINEEGHVGPIGGAGQKVVAAHKKGAEYFFAPNENGAPNSNYREALEVAANIGTTMEIVPVDTFDDAVAFLKGL